MKKVIFVIGLPCSGKTTLLSKIKDCGIVDDPKNFEQDVLKVIHKYDLIYIADPHFCNDNVLKEAKSILCRHGIEEFEYIYFENNPDQCIKNMYLRNDGRTVSEMIKYSSQVYNPPKDTIPVYKKREPI